MAEDIREEVGYVKRMIRESKKNGPGPGRHIGVKNLTTAETAEIYEMYLRLMEEDPRRSRENIFTEIGSIYKRSNPTIRSVLERERAHRLYQIGKVIKADLEEGRGVNYRPMYDVVVEMLMEGISGDLEMTQTQRWIVKEVWKDMPKAGEKKGKRDTADEDDDVPE